MHLEVTQQHLLRGLAQFHFENGRVEGLFLQRKVQRVVIELNQGGRARAINDARHLAGIAQAAARSGPLLCTLESGKFHFKLRNG